MIYKTIHAGNQWVDLWISRAENLSILQEIYSSLRSILTLSNSEMGHEMHFSRLLLIFIIIRRVRGLFYDKLVNGDVNIFSEKMT